MVSSGRGGDDAAASNRSNRHSCWGRGSFVGSHGGPPPTSSDGFHADVEGKFVKMSSTTRARVQEEKKLHGADLRWAREAMERGKTQLAKDTLR